MKKILNFNIIFIFILFTTGEVQAEQGCPAGQIPSQAGGSMSSCGPIPAGYYQQQKPAQPTGEWVKTWGAIAMGSIDSITSYGVTTGKRTKAEAETDALRRCASHGEKNCSVGLTYENQCAVIVEPQVDGKPLSGGFVRFIGRKTIRAASDDALAICKKDNSKVTNANCKIVYTACSEPFFQDF
ncbi:DUF4189 domain-containing protein [Xanthomonas sp. 4461]|uniref:DUF4189 domain-containing protein n=1 Tax=Xanthomonas sp. 4461 TaxID=3035313 RepID=UPI0021684289|nr:DUF4189 domain-containing protein [Xanthomonas sp. 4461]MCS3810061.1 hypothetical protein [Xanthomonas sp. 4461]